MEGIEVGAYAVKKRTGKSLWLVKVEDPGDFPAYRKLFKEDPPVFEGKWRGMTKYGAALFELCYSFPEPTALNIGYLEDIGFEEWNVKWWKPDAGVVFEAKDRTAIIMTINIERGNFITGK